jgi:ligand-binding sensor domain-containing protein
MWSRTQFGGRPLTAFCDDKAGNLWIGFYGGGLMRFRDGRFDALNDKDGLLAYNVRQIYQDGRSRLWIATYAHGLLRIDNPALGQPAVRAYTTIQALSSNAVEAVIEDSWGRLYVATALVVDRLEPESGRIQHYTTADGLVKGELHLAFRDRQGALWFASQQGLSRWLPEPDTIKKVPPVLLTGLRIAGTPRRLSDLGESTIPALELDSDENHMQVDFVGLDFAPGETLHYQCMLAAADRDWSTPTDQRTVNYANLKPGSYQFRVRAVNTQDEVSARPAEFDFTIRWPVWQRWWFFALMGLATASIVYALHRNRVMRLLELERVRLRIATDLHDDRRQPVAHRSTERGDAPGTVPQRSPGGRAA